MSQRQYLLHHHSCKVTQAQQDAGFVFDPTDKANPRSRNENRYTLWQLPYDSVDTAELGLRPTIQIELPYSLLRLPLVTLPIRSFIAEAYDRPPEISALACVSVTQTAAEKLVALTRRTAMEMAGLSRDIDTALIRHVYDLHMMRTHIDPDKAAVLAREIAQTTPTSSATNIPPMPATWPARRARPSTPCAPIRRTRAAMRISWRPWSMASKRNLAWQ